MSDKIWTIGSILDWTVNYFKKHNIDSPRLDAELLLAHVLKKERIFLYVEFDKPLEQEELDNYKSLIIQRAKHIPIAYILKTKEFYGREFIVSEDTLIPRPDTEVLVDGVLEKLPCIKEVLKNRDIKILDLGTGTGAIILTLLSEIENAQGVAVDISTKALEIFRKNCDRFELDNRCKSLQSDLFSSVDEKEFSIIVSNPPYIPKDEMDSLSIDVKEYEPHLALTDHSDGLEFYRLIFSKAQDYLIDGGILAVEIGIGQSEYVRDLAYKNNWFDVEIIKDYAGIDRVVIAWKQR